MQIDAEYLAPHQSPQDSKWVLLVLGSDDKGVIYHGSGTTVTTTDTELTLEAFGEAEIEARKLGLYKFYIERSNA